MKNNLYYRIPTGHPHWHKMRTTGLTKEEAAIYGMPPFEGGIGASEMASVLGLSDYNPTAQELFHWKVGSMQPLPFDNPATFHGRHLEPYVKDLWQCSDGTEDGYMKVYEAWKSAPAKQRDQHLIKRARRINAIIVNPDYPFLPVNLDYYANEGAPCMMMNHSMYTMGEVVPGGFPVEIKTIGSMAAKALESGLPDSYVSQVNQQMIACVTTYAELGCFILGDKRKFETFYFERSNTMCNNILMEGKQFWDRVMQARVIYAEIQERNSLGDYTEDEKLMSHITALEPDVDANKAYKKYYSENYKKDDDFTSGDQMLYLLARKHKFVSAIIKELGKIKTYTVNQLTERFVQERVEKFIFGQDPKKDYLRYYKKSNGVNFQFDNRLKFNPEPSDVLSEIKKINLF